MTPSMIVTSGVRPFLLLTQASKQVVFFLMALTVLLHLLGTVSVSSSVVQAFSNPGPEGTGPSVVALSPEALMDACERALVEHQNVSLMLKDTYLLKNFQDYALPYGADHAKVLLHSIENDIATANAQANTIMQAQVKLQQQSQDPQTNLQQSIDQLTSAIGRIYTFKENFDVFCKLYLVYEHQMTATAIFQLEKKVEGKKWRALSDADKQSLEAEHHKVANMVDQYLLDYERLQRVFYQEAFVACDHDDYSIVKVEAKRKHQESFQIPTSKAIYDLDKKIDDKDKVINANSNGKPNTNVNSNVNPNSMVNPNSTLNSNVNINTNANIKPNTNSASQYCLKCIKVSAAIAGLMAFGGLIGKVIDDYWNDGQDRGGNNGSLPSLITSAMEPTGGSTTLEPSSIGPIVIGGVVVIALLIALVYFLVRKRVPSEGHDPETGKLGQDIPSEPSSIGSTGVEKSKATKSKAKSHKQGQSSNGATVTPTTGTPLTTTLSARAQGSKGI